MILLENGIGVQIKEWQVTESYAAGFCRVYYILSGDITYYDESKTLKLKIGNLYVFPEGKPYRIVHNPDKPIECLWFHIDFFPSSVPDILEFEIESKPDTTIYHIIKALKNEGKFFFENDNLYLSLTEALSEEIIKHPKIAKTDTTIAEVLDFIRNNLFDSKMNVISLSQRFGYSTAHFIRMFKSKMNTTPHQYITILRMSSAAKSLIDGVSVLETAAANGFSDVKTYSRAFKKIYGIAPSNYVKYYHPKA